MRHVWLLAAVIAVATLAALPSRAEPVPDEAIGIWSATECGSDGLTVLVDSNAALMFEERGEQTWVAMAWAEWHDGSVVVTMMDETHELVLPPLESLERCNALPAAFALTFAESVTVFREIDEIMALCVGEDIVATQCLTLVSGMIDVSGDWVFSKAEISRAVRAASFFIGYAQALDESEGAFVSVEELSIAWFAASVLAPFVAAHLIDSYDFNDDDRLNLGELLQDRSPEEGIQGVAAGLATKVPPEVMSGLMKSMNGLFGLLH